MNKATPTPSNSHLHFFNHHTGHPRFHFEAASDAVAATASGTKPWHDGIDTEMIGHAQNKGWKLDDPKEAFSAAAKVARDLERHFGVPADRIVKIPATDAKPEDLRAYYERLGAPKEAKDYDLSAVKDTGVADALRNAAFATGLPKEAAATVAKAVASALESKTSTDNAVTTAKLAEQKENLTKNWGDKYAYNHLQAIEGARRLGISPEGVKAMEGVIGYDQVMEAMRKIGANTREDTFHERPPGGPAGDVTTLEGAKARKSELMADNAWVTKYNAGDPAAKREMTRLNQMITGVTA